VKDNAEDDPSRAGLSWQPTDARLTPYPTVSHLGFGEQKSSCAVRVSLGAEPCEDREMENEVPNMFRFVGNCKGQDRNHIGTIELHCVVAPGITAAFQVH
jgi:hypothetical protein